MAEIHSESEHMQSSNINKRFTILGALFLGAGGLLELLTSFPATGVIWDKLIGSFQFLLLAVYLLLYASPMSNKLKLTVFGLSCVCGLIGVLLR